MAPVVSVAACFCHAAFPGATACNRREALHACIGSIAGGPVCEVEDEGFAVAGR